MQIAKQVKIVKGSVLCMLGDTHAMHSIGGFKIGDCGNAVIA